MVDRNETFDTLRARIMDRYESLSPHLQRLARIALTDPNQMALETVASITATAGVQPSTLIRFAKEFGYDGFSKMQKVFKLRLVEGAPFYREQVYEARSERMGGNGDKLDRCADALIDSLEQLKRTASREDIARAVELLNGADYIMVAGLRRARPIAAYLAYGLMRLERRCSILDFDGGMAAQQVANMGRGDVLAAIAFPEYSPPVVDVVKEAHLRDISVIALTDAPASPLAANATLSFFVDYGAKGAFRPVSAAIGLVQTFIESLAEQKVP
jgi:DNA-binding MurR/RpiR family transcriptional regulator